MTHNVFQHMSIVVILLYVWRIDANLRKYGDLEDVYYGVQIAYMAIVCMHVSMAALSVVLLLGIHRENAGMVVPWIVGMLTFMALEAVTMVYSNVLRDHVNRVSDTNSINQIGLDQKAPIKRHDMT